MKRGEEGQDLFDPNDTIGRYTIISSLEYKSRNYIYKAFIPGNIKDYYVVKALPYQTEKEKQKRDKEDLIMSHLRDQPFILPVIETLEYEAIIEEEDENEIIEEKPYSFLCIVTPFCDNLDLRDVYNKNMKKCEKTLKLNMCKRIFYQSLKILEFLHRNKIVHHDIKPDNFLVKQLNPIEIILIDFELADQLNESGFVKHKCGTIYYMSPEVLDDKNHDISADIWSLGVMMYYLYFGHFPFNIKQREPKETIKWKVQNGTLSFPNELDSPLPIELLRKMLEKVPSNRISALEAKSNLYFQEFLDIASETKGVINELSRVQREYENAENIEDKSSKED